MKIEGRKSIHDPEKKAKLDDYKSIANNEESKNCSVVDNNTTYVRKELNASLGSEKSAVITGSQEELYEEDLYDTEYSRSISFKSETGKHSVKSSPLPRKRNQNVSRLRTESPIRYKEVPGKKTKQVPSVLLKIILACVGICLFFYLFLLSDSSEYTCSFEHLKKKYSNENAKIWKYLRSDVEYLLNEKIKKPSVTLFIHKGYKGSKELIRDIAKAASNCIESSLEPVEFNNSVFTSDDAARDYGVIIDKYKRETKEGTVVMIADLSEIPAEAARALHSICDRESPIFRKVIILLSLTVQDTGGRPIEVAENALYELWKGRIKENELGPLMARVTEEVFQLETF